MAALAELVPHQEGPQVPLLCLHSLPAVNYCFGPGLQQLEEERYLGKAELVVV